MTLLFDLDGTLLDTAPDFVTTLHQLQHEEKHQVDKLILLEQVRPWISHGSRHIIHRTFNINEQHPHEQRLIKRFLSIYQDLATQSRLFDGVEQTLQFLDENNIRWGIVTNKPEYLTHPLLKQLDLHHRPACIVGGDTTPYRKPHPASLLHACKLLKCEPSECLYLGDAETDVTAGKAAGMLTAAALYGYVPNHDEAMNWPADYQVLKADQLPEIIQQWQQAV